MISSYISLQGRSAGPIQIGNQGVWLQTTNNITGSGGELSFVNNVNSTQTAALCRLRAGATNMTDNNSVVTVESLKAYVTSHPGGGGSVDINLSDYIKTETFNNLYTIVMGSEIQYTDKNSIKIRVQNVERQIEDIDSLNDIMVHQFNTLNKTVALQGESIGLLQESIKDLGAEVFKNNTILYAGPPEVI